MWVKKTIPLIVVTMLVGCSSADVPEDANRVVYEETSAIEASGTRITKIELVRKVCNKLTMRVSYYNDGSKAGRLLISSNAGIPDQLWPMPANLKTGNHVIEIQNGISTEASASKSQEIRLAIEHHIGQDWEGFLDTKTFPYQREWDNSCI